MTLILAALLATYSLATWWVYRRRNILHSAALPWLLLLLTAAALFCLILLFQPALFSDDVFTYMFSGRLLAFYHVDPLNNAPIQFPLDPYLQWVVSGRFTANFYGPLWLYISSGLVSMSGGPVVTLFLFKGVAFLTHLVNCILVWAILTRLAPTRRLLGTLLYAWNPLAIIELAGSGHSEGLLLTILLLATLIYIRGKGRWHEIAVLVSFGLAISMNLVVLLFAPLFTWFIVRAERNGYRAFWGFCWRTLVGLGLVIPLFLPLWRGPATFFSITSAIDLTNFSHSLVGLIEGPLEWIFGLVDQWSHFPTVMQPMTAADSALRASTLFIFALIYFRLFGKVRVAPMLNSADSETLVPGLLEYRCFLVPGACFRMVLAMVRTVDLMDRGPASPGFTYDCYITLVWYGPFVLSIPEYYRVSGCPVPTNTRFWHSSRLYVCEQEEKKGAYRTCRMKSKSERSNT